MAFFLRAKKLSFETGTPLVALLHERDAFHAGIRPGDRLDLSWGNSKVTVLANTATGLVARGEIGLFKEVWNKRSISALQPVQVVMSERPKSIVAIQKKLLGKTLTEPEIRAIIDDIVGGQLSDIQITYFVAASFAHEYTDTELYWLTKAMAETGEMLKFRGMVVDKHSVGGLAGNRTTMVAIPIVASTGLIMPKTSSRAITSPSGTADTMEVLAPVSFSAKQIQAIVSKVGACLVWGGGLNLAPADDKIIKVSYPLALEPYTKMLVSIMAKKVACGVNTLIIDMPVGPTTKIPDMAKAEELEERFIMLGKRFGMKIKVMKTLSSDPVGSGIGPALEARDVLRVLQQKDDRPTDLEDKAIKLAGDLMEMAGKAAKGRGAQLARQQLLSGAAWKKMQQIIKAQGGDETIDSEKVTLGAHKLYVSSKTSGRVKLIDNRALNDLARTLGAPSQKLAGLYLNKKIGDKVAKGERLFTCYAATNDRIELAKQALTKLKVVIVS
jgi:AMP phosphorylase